MAFIADRMDFIKPSPTLAITQKARELKAQGIDIIELGAGEPDFDTPANIRAAAKVAIDSGYTKYTAVDGIKELKEAIIRKFKRDNNLEYDLANITVGTGGKQVLFNAILATVNPGDEVIIPSPYWVSYPDMVAFAEGVSVIVRCEETTNFKITPQQLEAAITPKTKWFILNSPSNPTGSSYTKIELLALAEVLQRHPHVHIMSDDIYEHVIYDDFKFYNIKTLIPGLGDRVFIVNGVSKTYAMTGWRIGYGAGPAALIKAMAKVQSQSTSNPCSIAQYAALEALDGQQDFIAEHNKIFQARRDMVVANLNNIPGLTCQTPEGAFYVYPSMKALIGKCTEEGKVISNCTDFTEYLLHKANVAVVQGAAFGLEGHFRISYATSNDILHTGMLRIKKACSELK